MDPHLSGPHLSRILGQLTPMLFTEQSNCARMLESPEDAGISTILSKPEEAKIRRLFASIMDYMTTAVLIMIYL